MNKIADFANSSLKTEGIRTKVVFVPKYLVNYIAGSK